MILRPDFDFDQFFGILDIFFVFSAGNNYSPKIDGTSRFSLRDDLRALCGLHIAF